MEKGKLLEIIDSIGNSEKTEEERFRELCLYVSSSELDIRYDSGDPILGTCIEYFPEWLEWIKTFPNLISGVAKFMGKETYNPDLLKKLCSIKAYERELIREEVRNYISGVAMYVATGGDITSKTVQYKFREAEKFGVPSEVWLVNLFAPRVSYSNHPYIDNEKYFILL